MLKNAAVAIQFIICIPLAGSCNGLDKSVPTNDNQRLISSNSDTWRRVSPNGDEGWESIDNSRVHVVISGMRDAAIKLLRDTAIVGLTPEDAATFIGVDARSHPSGTQAYLVRALEIESGTGKLRLFRKSGAIKIVHGSLGRQPGFMVRRPLVVFLTSRPDVVYVEVRGAE